MSAARLHVGRAAGIPALMLAAMLAGCRSADRVRTDRRGTTRLPGLRAMTADSFGIHLRRDPDSGWLLWADGHFTDAATVHPGETFLLRHHSGLRRWYRVVAIDEDRLSLIEVEERPLPRGQAQSRRVVYVQPYDLDQPEAKPQAPAPRP